ncbi:MAG TPA: efflux transporter outer membrane subunit, partial [Mucilaginibacter sp.]|nr:efflux transporter outer membrane subunit [Mucilaginibacter sp.]
MKKYISGLSILLIALAACNVSKNVGTPKTELPDHFGNFTATADTSSVADIPWRKFFTDPTLQKLIDSAIVKNYDMQLALKNIQASELLLKQVKWNNMPQIDLNVSANTSRPADNSLNGVALTQYGIKARHIENYQADVSLSWEADIWGKIRNQSKSALAALLQTAEARKLVQTSIVAGVSQGYFNLLMLDEQLAIAKRNVLLNDSTLRIIQLEFNSGQVTSLAVQQARAQREAAAELVPQFEQNIALQENALQILAGKLPGKVERTASLNDIAFADNLSAGVPSAILERRPDVRTKELALNIANANVGITKAEMYPALRITADGGINSFKASNWFNIPASLFGIVGASVLQPLVDHKQLKTQFEVSKVNREKAVIEFRQTVLNAVGEVSDAMVNIE